MSKIPYYYNYQNLIDSSVNPSAINVTCTKTATFFRRYLLQKAMSVFRWKFPENWSKDYFLYTLYCTGCVAVINTDKFGVIPQQGVPFGYTVQYQPRQISIANPLLQGIKAPIIGEECTVFKMTADWGGIMDLVAFYGDYMALIAQTFGVNLINSKLAYIFAAENKSTAEAMKKAFDSITAGEPAVVVDKKLLNDRGELAIPFVQQNLSGSFIANDVLTAWRQIENMFCTAVGIPSANLDKRERMITAEVNANNVETVTTADMWLDGWRQACLDTMDMFGVEVSVDWRIKDGSGMEEVDFNA